MTLKQAARWEESTLNDGLKEAGVNKFQTGTVREYLAELKKTLDAPAPASQPGKPPLLPLYFSGRDVGDEWVFSFFFLPFFIFFCFLFFVFHFLLRFFFFFPLSLLFSRLKHHLKLTWSPDAISPSMVKFVQTLTISMFAVTTSSTRFWIILAELPY